MEDGDVEALCSNNREATVGVTKDENCIGLGLVEEFVGAVNDITTSSTEVIAYSIHIDFGILELEVVEEYAIEVVVVVLTCVSKDYIKILAALVDDCCKTDNLRTCTYNDTELEFTILLPLYV